MINRMKNNKVLMSIASLGSATLLNAALVFIVEIISRNILGPEKYGYWLTVSILFTFIPIFQLGTLNAMNREVPYFLAKNDQKKVQEIRESVLSFIFNIPVLMILVLFVISIFILLTETKYEYKIGFVLASVIAVFTYFSNYAEMYYKSEQNFKKASRLISIKSISQSLITITLVFSIGYIGLYLGMLFALIIEIAVAKEIFPKISRKYTFTDYNQLIKTGFPILIVGLVWSIMIATDRIIISLYMSPTDLGNYGVGMLVFSSLMLLPQVLSQVFYPKVVELVSQGKFNEIKILYKKVNSILAVVMLAIVVIGYFLIPPFITWFMPEYIRGIEAAQILLIGIYPLTLVSLAAIYFNSTNNQRIYLLIQLISIILNFLISIILLNYNKSITSVAFATSISFVVYCILMNTFFIFKIRQTKEY